MFQLNKITLSATASGFPGLPCQWNWNGYPVTTSFLENWIVFPRRLYLPFLVSIHFHLRSVNGHN